MRWPDVDRDERIASAILVLVGIAALLPSAVSAVVSPERVDGTGVERLVRAVCLFAFVVFLGVQLVASARTGSRPLLRNGPLVVALLAYWLVGMTSVLWNDRSLPQISALAIPFVVVALAAYGGGPRLGVRITEYFLVAACYASLGLAVAYPRAAFPSGATFEGARLLDFLSDQRLAGIASHPNTIGLLAALAVLLVGIRRGRFWPVHLVAAASVLALSESRTAIVALGVALVVALAANARPELAGRELAVALAASLGCVIVVLPVLAAMGALDVSFNGRATVWDYALSRVADHPLLGLGPGVWVDFVASGDLTDLATSGHNQFVESLTTVGIAGLVFLGVLAVFWLRALAPRRSGEAVVAIGAFGLIWAFAILESPITLWGVSPQSWIVVMLTVCCLGLDRRITPAGSGDSAPPGLTGKQTQAQRAFRQ